MIHGSIHIRVITQLGEISRHLVRCLPQVLACYLLPTINFSLLYRDFMMTKFEFFTNREERWGDSMRALWGSLSICPLLDHVDLPYHTVGGITFYKLP